MGNGESTSFRSETTSRREGKVSSQRKDEKVGNLTIFPASTRKRDLLKRAGEKYVTTSNSKLSAKSS